MNIAVALLALASAAAAQDGQDPEKDRRRRLSSMSLEDLMKVEITSVARKEQPLRDAASAVTVIDSDDLRRSGVRSLPEALRLVPGMHVSRIDANKWAVSSRGFHDRFSNKLQVMVDGRSVYSPLFSGVHWDRQDPMIEDIERIEVIRGPGATVWGSNAVTGVVNVITKKARDTQGGLVVAGGGTEERDFGAARYGARVGEELSLSAYAKYFNREEAHQGRDDWFQSRGGFRSEWTPSKEETWTLQGEYYDGESRGVKRSATAAPPFSVAYVDAVQVSGGHILGRWERRLSDRSDVSFQVSGERSDQQSEVNGEVRDTVEVDLRHRLPLFEGHDVVWGAGYRLTADDIRETPYVAFDPTNDTVGLAHLFAQDEVDLGGGFKGTLGSKFEYNEYTGFEYQPGVRLAWTPAERQFLWGAVSRAVRIPARFEPDVRLPIYFAPGLAGPVPFAGSDDFRSEELTSFEAGWRTQPADFAALDLAFFFDVYDDLQTIELEAGQATFKNRGSARSYGAEPALTFRLAEGWTLRGSYTFLHVNLDRDDDSGDPNFERQERAIPRGRSTLRLGGSPLEDVEIDVIGRYAGGMSARDVDSYVELDLRLGWRVQRDVEISLVGQNLLHDEHAEFNATQLGEQPTEVERGVYASVSWRF